MKEKKKKEKGGNKKKKKESCGLFGARNPEFSFGTSSHQGLPEGCMGLNFQKHLEGSGARLIVRSDLD